MSTVRHVIQRRRERRRRAHTGTRRVVQVLTVFGVILAALASMAAFLILGGAVSAYTYYSDQLPEPGTVTQGTVGATPTRLYDRTGQVMIDEVSDPLRGSRRWVLISDMPVAVRDAAVAFEDPDFYERPRYSVLEAFGGAWSILSGGEAQRGSPITRHLVRNLLAASAARDESAADQKMRELVLTLRISEKYSPDQILEWYLNTNPYGNLAYGIEAAAQVYFGKPLSELTLAEAAMLAAIPQSPTLNPIDNMAQAKDRQALVLHAMLDQGKVTPEQASVALAAPLDLNLAGQRLDLLAPHFSIAARKQLEEIVGTDRVYRGNLVVNTTLDYGLFLQAECAARSHIARLSGQPSNTVIPASDGSECTAADVLQPIQGATAGIDHHVTNTAVVVMDVQTGEILTMVGSLDYYNSLINGGVNFADSQRQPGPAIMPFAYLTAFQQGYTTASMMLDIPTEFTTSGGEPIVPDNADGQFRGPISIRSALANSYNVPAVQVTNWVGVDNVIRTTHAMGINSLSNGISSYDLSLTLGGGDGTLTDLTYAYSVLANQGEMHGKPTSANRRAPGFRTLDPVLILRVADSDGNILWEYGRQDTAASAPVVEPSLAYLVTDILADDVSRRASVGPNSVLTLDRPAAVIAGATTDLTDNWTIGYTPQIAVGVWVGNADNTSVVGLTPIEGAAPIWKAVMTAAHANLPVQTWVRPADITELTVCQPSGLLPTPYCPTYQEVFKRGTEPLVTDNIYQPFSVNKDTGLLATVFTPPQLVEQRIYQVLPPEAADWVREAGIPQPPTAYDTLGVPELAGNVAITKPDPYSYVRGIVSIHGSARDASFRLYRMDYGAGLNPDQWFQIGDSSESAVSDGSLGSWNTAGLDGLFSLRLTMIRSDNSFEESIIQVTVDNVPPSVLLSNPANGEQFSQSDEYVSIQPVVADNVAMDRVEVFIDNELFSTSTTAPFNVRWPLGEIGEHVIQISAYDAAGNEAISEKIVIEVVP
jgi:membrane peptidoglycan carboxypeptidase